MQFSNIGVGVSDLDRSRRFYCEAMEFDAADYYEFPVEGGVARIQFVQHASLRVELICFPRDRTVDTREIEATRGLTHLAFMVEDGESVATRIEALGGSVEKRSQHADETGKVVADLILCRDPDGVRIELIQPIAK